MRLDKGDRAALKSSGRVYEIIEERRGAGPVEERCRFVDDPRHPVWIEYHYLNQESRELTPAEISKNFPSWSVPQASAAPAANDKPAADGKPGDTSVGSGVDPDFDPADFYGFVVFAMPTIKPAPEPTVFFTDTEVRAYVLPPPPTKPSPLKEFPELGFREVESIDEKAFRDARRNPVVFYGKADKESA